MPYFFVDGNRDGKPSSALYVQAENEDAALLRAAQLGMNGTDVRPAKAMDSSEPFTPRAFAWATMPAFILICLDAFDPWFSDSSQTRHSHLAVPLIFLTVMVYRTYCLAYRQHESQRQLKADIQSLQSTIQRMQPQLDPVNSDFKERAMRCP